MQTQNKIYEYPYIKITKYFVNSLWNINPDPNTKGSNLSIQDLRFFMYIAREWNENFIIHTNRNRFRNDVFTYVDKDGNKKNLINFSDYNKFLSSKKKIIDYDPESKKIILKFNFAEFNINTVKKEELINNRFIEIKKINKGWKESRSFEQAKYEIEKDYNNNNSYYKLKKSLWDLMKTRKSEYDHKLFFYILSEKLRGQFKNIKIDLSELIDRLQIEDNNNRRAKTKIISSLVYLKEIEFISDFSFNKNNLIITKYDKKKEDFVETKEDFEETKEDFEETN